MREVDLVIVGAGFAGLTCAQAAAARGVSTLVLERKIDPGANTHTTGIFVKEVADAWDVPRRYTRKIHGVRLYSPNLRYVDLVSPGYYFLATDTPAVMRWLAGIATETGVEVRCSTSYQGAALTNDGLQLVHHDIRCRQLVGCDGPRSRVAGDFRLGRNRQFLTGIEAEFEGVTDLDEDRLHVFLDSGLAPGYIAWVVPGVGITQVGLAARRPPAGRLDQFIHKLKSLFNFDHARQIGRRGGLIPCGGTVRPFATERVLLLGDAAGMVSPLTAGGIHPAMGIGRAAGVALSDYLLENGPAPQRAIRGLLPSFFYKQLMRAAFDLAPPNWIYDCVLESRILRSAAQTVFFHHRGLFSVQAWREMVLAARTPVGKD